MVDYISYSRSVWPPMIHGLQSNDDEWQMGRGVSGNCPHAHMNNDTLSSVKTLQNLDPLEGELAKIRR